LYNKLEHDGPIDAEDVDELESQIQSSTTDLVVGGVTVERKLLGAAIKAKNLAELQ